METNMRLNLLLVCVLLCTKRKISAVRNYLQTQWANVFVCGFISNSLNLLVPRRWYQITDHTGVTSGYKTLPICVKEEHSVV